MPPTIDACAALERLLPGGGETGALIRATDWSTTPLGPLASWPPGLVLLVRTMLAAPQPISLYWGADQLQLYNDASIAIYGEKHPRAFGRPARESWPEVWAVTGKELRAVLERGEPTFHQDVLMPVVRDGRLTDAWWTYSYSPAYAADGSVGGTLLVCTETTHAVLARRRLERSLREVELAREELHGFLQQAPVPVCILAGPEHRFTFANPAYIALVAREVVGKTLAEAFAPGEVNDYRPLLDRVFQTGESVAVHGSLLRIPGPTGAIEDRYIDFGYHACRNHELAVVGVMAIHNDVTAQVLERAEVERLAALVRVERNKAELAVARFDQLFQRSPVFITLLRTPAHVFELLNPAYARLVGERPLLGRPVREAIPEVEGQGYFELLDRVYSTGQPFVGQEVPIRLRRKPGGPEEEAFVTFTYEPFRLPSGAIDGVICFGIDVTETVLARRRVEVLAADEARARLSSDLAAAELANALRERRTLAEAIQQSGDFIGLAQPDGGGIWLNEAGRRLVGLGRVQSLESLRLLDFFPQEEQARLRDEVLPLVTAGGRWEGELAFRHFLTGERIAVWYSVFAVRDAGGACIALGTVTRDIRAQKLLETERAALLSREQGLRIEAETAGRARDEFLAMLGHEMRNPLAPISTATRLMALRGDHHQRERLVIERQVVHLSRLVDDLLDVARIARGRIDLQRAPIEIAEIVAKAVEMASPLLEKREHHFRVEVPPQGLLVDGDAVRLSQVISNLLTNAAKYTQPGGHIALTAAREAGEVVVTVVDDGPGLPPDLLPRIFDIFVQGERTLERAEGGLGLGLALVKNLVTLHGGSVAAKNRAQAGSEFSVRLPALDAAEVPRPPATVTLLRAPRRVLLVDDNAEAAQSLAELLRALGHEVQVAFDGPQALEALGSFRAEVFVLDLGLPMMDGFDLAERIRQRDGHAHPRLIALTGYGQTPDRRRSQRAGFDHHLTKPVDLAMLRSAIEG